MDLIFCFYCQDANHIHVTLFRLSNVNPIVPFRWIELQELRSLMKLEQLVYVLWVNTTTAQVSWIFDSSYMTPLPKIGVSDDFANTICLNFGIEFTSFGFRGCVIVCCLVLRLGGSLRRFSIVGLSLLMFLMASWINCLKHVYSLGVVEPPTFLTLKRTGDVLFDWVAPNRDQEASGDGGFMEFNRDAMNHSFVEPFGFHAVYRYLVFQDEVFLRSQDDVELSCSSLLAEEFRLLPEIRLLQGDEQQTIHKQ
ncbi:hypothetical protein OUZ56_016806 [Daphnia magna]|uniref:Uncharacterized protein n=1 Tax=Daphnia magna TaxID=35525 RepID=A0ABR0ARM0_9CRUS|nr:hypothetical protein OUZ56_016806 [Daphnia magna]